MPDTGGLLTIGRSEINIMVGSEPDKGATVGVYLPIFIDGRSF